MLKKILKVLKWIGIVVLVGFVIIVIVRTVHFFNLDKTNIEVAKIHSTKLQMADVLGTNLPPDPGAEADVTVQGVDANKNGIRDDVELAIFKEYPNSAKTRAVLLQYALALQMQFTQPIVNETTVTEVIREHSRADTCLNDVIAPRVSPESSRDDNDIKKIERVITFVESKQLNTTVRQEAQDAFYKYLRSYSDLEDVCDIDYSKLSN